MTDHDFNVSPEIAQALLGWSKLDEYTSTQAAALWNNVPPGKKVREETRQLILATEKRLIDEVKFTDKSNTKVYNSPFPMQRYIIDAPAVTIFKKIVLKTYAKKIEYYPFFLFPERQKPLSPPPQPETSLRNSRRHTERCRALAAYLWRLHPEMTLEDMAKHPAISEFCLENSRYALETIKNWIRNLNPNQKPGRRPKK